MMTVTVQDGKLTFNSETGRWEDEDANIGCMSCKYNFENNCLIICCGTYDCLGGISKCNFKYWEYKDE